MLLNDLVCIWHVSIMQAQHFTPSYLQHVLDPDVKVLLLELGTWGSEEDLFSPTTIPMFDHEVKVTELQFQHLCQYFTLQFLEAYSIKTL